MKRRRLRIYVAGAYTSTDIMQVFKNMRKGMHIASQVLQCGMAPFTPWHDYHHILQDNNEFITVEDMYEQSASYLPICDAMLLVHGYKKSHGVMDIELPMARNLNIPVFETLNELVDWANENDNLRDRS